LLLVPTDQEIELHPADVGIGISQVVPVIVTALDGEGRIVAIEQPELHIHPRLQAELGDLFIEAARKGQMQFLIETHSEHLVLRMLRRIRETSEGELPPGHPGLEPAQLLVAVVDPPTSGPGGSPQGTRVHQLRIDNTGEFLDPWPHGFFEERAKELF
jgi:predicted ATPase